MRILAIYRHYWPDVTPYARLLRAILEEAAREGHAATVYTAQPSYNDVRQASRPRREAVGGVQILRAALPEERKTQRLRRLLNMVLFLAGGMLHALRHRRRYDLIIANTHPPVLMGWMLRILSACTGIPYILHAQDIHPESAELAGQMQSGWLTRFLRQVDTGSCLKAARVVTLSDDMRQTLLRRPGSAAAAHIDVINNFPLDRYTAAADLPAQFASEDCHFRVLFAGNMGLFQQLDRLIDVAHQLSDHPEIRFVFMGAGAARQSLQQQAGELLGKTIFFEEHQPVEVAFACMQRADLGVVSLSPGVYQVAYPSKTMMYLAAGCPVLGLLEAESCLADSVRQHELGYIPEALTVESIAATILSAWQQRRRWKPETRRALTARAEALFGREQALACWMRLFRRLQKPAASESIVSLPQVPPTSRRAA